MYTEEEILSFAKDRNLSREQFRSLLESIGKENIGPAEAPPPVATEPVTEAPTATLPEVTVPTSQDELRLDAAFRTFNKDEPLDVTKNRRDIAKGFVDSSPEGTDLSEIMRLQKMDDPRDSFTLFEDGFHTPAMKQPHHPSFVLNDPRKQAIAQLLFPDQKGFKPNRNAVEQLIDHVAARQPYEQPTPITPPETTVEPGNQGMFGFQSVAHPELKGVGGEEQFTPDPNRVGMVDRTTANLGIGLNQLALGMGGLLNDKDMQEYHRNRILELRETFPKELIKEMDTPLYVPDSESWTGYSINPETSLISPSTYGKLIQQVPNLATSIGGGAALTKNITPILSKVIDKIPIKAVRKLFKPLGGYKWAWPNAKFAKDRIKDKAITGIGGMAGFGIAEGLISGGFSRAEVGHAIRHAPEELLTASPRYKELLAEGNPPETARELLADELSGAAMRKSAITTGILGAPLGAYFGKLVKFKDDSLFRRLIAGGLGEAGQEIPQEFMEGIIAEVAKGEAGLPVEKIEMLIARALEAGTIATPAGSFASGVLGAGGSEESKIKKLKDTLKGIDIEDSTTIPMEEIEVTAKKEEEEEDTFAGSLAKPRTMGEPEVIKPEPIEEGFKPPPIEPEKEPPPAPPIVKVPEPDPKIEAEKKRIEEEERQKIIETNKRKEEEARIKAEEERKKKEDPVEIEKAIKKAITPGKTIETEEVRKIIREAPTEQAKKVVEQEIERATVSKARATVSKGNPELEAKKKRLAELKKKKKKPVVAPEIKKPREAVEQDLKLNEEKLKEIKQKPGFKKFFKKSKVSSDKGEPVVVYHGTQSQEPFTVFKPKDSFGGWNYFGNWFTSEPDFASHYAALPEPKESGPVIPAYLSIQNPWETNWEEMTETFRNVLGMKHLGESQGTHEQELATAKKLREYLKSKGYDGVIIKGFTGDSDKKGDDRYRTQLKQPQDIFIALESNQIRSPFAKFEDVTGPDILGDQAFADATTDEDAEIKALEEEIRKETYDELLEDYKNQPRAQQRTSTSIGAQAYSTPLPIGYLAGELARVGDANTVFEPTAGHGALVVGADPDTVTANEIDPDRRKTLEESGFKVSEKDASKELAVPPKSQDSVVMNPPFGKLDSPVDHEGYTIKKLDHLIAVKNLEAMKDSGRAVLILGANLRQSKDLPPTPDRVFMNYLYNNYNVVDHFEIGGKLYDRMGASFPIRMITIAGRRKSQTFPDYKQIKRVEDFNDLYTRFKEAHTRSERVYSPTAERGAGSAPSGEGIQSTTKSGGVPVDVGKGSARGGQEGGVERTTTDPASGRSIESGEPTSVRGEPREVGGGIDVPTGSTPISTEVPIPSETTGQPEREARGEGLPRGTKPTDTPRTRSVAKVDPEDLVTPYEQTQSPGTSENINAKAGVQVPSNMAEGMKRSMERLVKEVGPFDDFVMKELGYKTKEELFKDMFGAQIDGVAMAIAQAKKGNGFIIADQTGLGKGRQAAAMIDWAKRNGRVPIFVTARDNLFSPMYQDIRDIGKDVKPFIMNQTRSGNIIDSDKNIVHRVDNDKKYKQNLEQIAKGNLPEGRDVIFTTYSQFQAAGASKKKSAIKSIAPKALFILDEMHKAAGEASNTNEYFMELLNASRGNGTVYLSATFAKRATNLPLLFTTNLSKATEGNLEALIELAQEGGLPFQRVVSAALAEEGQLVNRRTSFKGIEVDIKAPNINTPEGREQERIETERSDKVTEIVRAINALNKAMIPDIVKMQKEMIKNGEMVMGADGKMKPEFSLSTINFASIFHNLVSQFLLSTKVDTVVNDVIEAHKKGEKTLITLQNTMGSFLNQWIEDKDVSIGDSLPNFEWKGLLELNLKKVLTLRKKPANGGEVIKIPFPESELSETNKTRIKALRKAIKALDLGGDFPASPIDMVRMRLGKAGIKTTEVTGRDYVIDYDVPEGADPVLQAREPDENIKAVTVQRYQDGDIDSIIMNTSGAEGVSLHAKEGIKDLRRRHLFVWQPNGDINDQIQLMGRHNRVGQVNLPKITIQSSSLPSEKRPTAILAGKLEKLNANTTANSKSALTFDSTNIFNQIGDQIVAGWLEANPHVAAAIGIKPVLTEGEESGNLARKVTGKLAIMPVEMQTGFWEEVGESYNQEIDALNATGSNPLDTQFHDYRATPKGKEMVVIEETDKTSYFGSAAKANMYSVKKDYKFTKPEAVLKSVFEALGITVDDYNKGKASDTEAKQKWLDEKVDAARKHGKELIDGLNQEMQKAQEADDEKGMNSAIQRVEKAREQMNDFIAEIQRWIPGKAVVLNLDEDEMTGVVEDVTTPLGREGANPFALSQSSVKFIRNKGYAPIRLTLSKLRQNPDLKKGEEPLVSYVDRRSLEDIFVRGEQGDQRMNKYIITGNLISGLRGVTVKGKIIDYSDADGNRTQGILLPKSFDPKTDLRSEEKLVTPNDVIEFLKGRRAKERYVGYLDAKEGITDEIQISAVEYSEDIEISVPAGKRGAKWHQNKEIIALTGDFAGKRGKRLTVRVTGNQVDKVLNAILQKGPMYGVNLDIFSKTFKDETFGDDVPDPSKYTKSFGEGDFEFRNKMRDEASKALENTRGAARTGKWPADEPARDPSKWVSGGLPYVYTPDNPKYKPEKMKVLLRRILDKVASQKRGARPDLIRDIIRRGLGVPVTELPIHSSSTAGLYYHGGRRSGTIRTKNLNLIATIAHELGHHLRFKYPITKQYFVDHLEEIEHLSPAVYQKDPKSVQKEEGFAEFIRLYLTKRAIAERNAPGMLESFQTLLMNEPVLHAAMEEITYMVHEWQGLTPEERIAAKIGEPKFIDKLKNTTIRGITGLMYSSTNKFITNAFIHRWPLGLLTAELQQQIEKSGGQEAPLRPSDNPYYLEQLRKGLGEQLEQAFIGPYPVSFDFVDRLGVSVDPSKKRGISLRTALAPILDLNDSDRIADWGYWMVAKRSQQLYEENREKSLSENEFTGMLEKFETYPEEVKEAFRETDRRIKIYQDFFVDYAIDGGYLDPELGRIFKENFNYIPFFRVGEKGDKQGGKGAPFLRLYGGTSNIMDPIENIMSNTANILHAVNLNHVLIKTLEVAERLDPEQHSAVIEEVPAPKRKVDISTAEILRRIKEKDPKFEISPEAIEEMGVMQSFFVPTGQEDKRDQIITARRFDPETGKVKTIGIKFHNTELGNLLYTSAMAMRPQDMGPIAKFASLGARVARAGIILSPEFMFRNVARDTITAMINADENKKFIPGLDTLKGGLRVLADKTLSDDDIKQKLTELLGEPFVKSLEQHTEARRIANDFGGSYASQWLGQRVADPMLEKHKVKELQASFLGSPVKASKLWWKAKRKDKLGMFLRGISFSPIESLEALGDLTENASRTEAANITWQALRATPEEQANKPEEWVIDKNVDAAVMAAVNHREWLIDFGTKGAGQAVRLWTASVMFLNPRLQDMVKLFEKSGFRPSPNELFKFHKIIFWTMMRRLSYIAIPSILLTLDHDDEDWYKELTDTEKNSNIYITKDIKWPNPFTWGTIGMRLPQIHTELYLNLIRDKYKLTRSHMDQYKAAMKKALLDMVGSWPIPTVAEPMIEVWWDRDIYFDREIEGPYLKKYFVSGLRAKQKTPRTLVEFGKANPLMPLSPLQIDHLLSNHFTGFYDLTIMGADALTASVLDLPPEGKVTSWKKYPIIRSFVHDPKNQSYNRDTIRFRERLKELTKAQKSYIQLEEEEGEEYEEQMKEIKRENPLADSDINKTKVFRKDLKYLRGLRADIREIRSRGKEDYPNMTDKEINKEKRIEINELNAEIKELTKELNLEMDEEKDMEAQELDNTENDKSAKIPDGGMFMEKKLPPKWKGMRFQ